MRNFGAFLYTVLPTLALVGAMALWKLHGCPNEQQTKDILGAEGYTEVKTDGGGHGSSCGKDNSATGFSAQTSAGHPVKGVVCCGLVVKACTVRITEAGR